MVKSCCKVILFLITLSVTVSSSSYGQGYTIGSGDRIAVAFWQDPTLNFEVIVGEEGSIVLPVGGSVQAKGLTVEQLAGRIVERISLYNRNITNATVTIVEFGSRKVYVMGQVEKPGKYGFEVIPNLWEIITEAGGPREDANLRSVMIIRDAKGGDKQSFTVDLADILSNNNFNSLPKIESGDNIYIPAVVGKVASSGIGAVQAQENILFIYGAVGGPGVYTFDKQLNILEALITAGGPTDQAKLERVKVIRKTGAYSSVISVDVDRYAEESVPAFFMVQGGDAIYVPRKKRFSETFVWDLLMIAASATLTTLVYKSLR